MRAWALLGLAGCAVGPVGEPADPAGAGEAPPSAGEPLWPGEALGLPEIAWVGGAGGARVLLAEDHVAVDHGGERLTLRLPGRSEVAGVGDGGAVLNRYVGEDPAQWREGVTSASAARWEALLPGVDLEIAPTAAGVKATWTLAPGADPAGVRLTWDEAAAVRVEEDGSLAVHAPAGVWRDAPPVAWQGAQDIAVRWATDGEAAWFELGAYDRSQPLVIDPGVVFEPGFAYGDTVSVAGVAGLRDGGAITVANVAERYVAYRSATATDVVITRLRADGTVVWRSVYGGHTEQSWTLQPGGDDEARAVTVSRPRRDGVGLEPMVVIGGATTSTDLPKLQAILNQSGPAGRILGLFPDVDAFLAAFRLDTGALQQSTPFGGVGPDAIDALGAYDSGVLFAGSTRSAGLPLADHVTPSPTTTPTRDAFWAHLPLLGQELTGGSYVGGTGEELIDHVVVEEALIYTGARPDVRVLMLLTSTSERLVTGDLDTPERSGGFSGALRYTGKDFPPPPAQEWDTTWFPATAVVTSATFNDGGVTWAGHGLSEALLTGPLACNRQIGSCNPTGECEQPSAFVAYQGPAGCLGVWLGGSAADSIDEIVPNTGGVLVLGHTRSADADFQMRFGNPEPVGGDADLFVAAVDVSDQDDPVQFALRFGAADDLPRLGGLPGEIPWGLAGAGRADATVDRVWMAGATTGAVPAIGLRASGPDSFTGRPFVASLDPDFASVAVALLEAPEAIGRVGDPLTVRASVTNAGPEAAAGMRLELAVDPALLEPATVPDRCDPQPARPGVLTCRVPTLDRQREWSQGFTFTTRARGVARVVARLVPGPKPDLTDADNEARVEVPVAVPVLVPSLPANPHRYPILPEAPSALELTLRNVGVGAAPASTLTVRARGAIAMRAAAGGACAPDPSDPTALRCSVPEVPEGGSTTLPLTGAAFEAAPFGVLASGPAIGRLEATSVIALPEDTLTRTTTLPLHLVAPDLELAASWLPAETAAGTGSTLTLAVTNRGPGLAGRATVRATLPEALRTGTLPTECVRTGTALVCSTELAGFSHASWPITATLADEVRSGAFPVPVTVEHTMRPPTGTAVRVRDPNPANDAVTALLEVDLIDLALTPPAEDRRTGEVDEEQLHATLLSNRRPTEPTGLRFTYELVGEGLSAVRVDTRGGCTATNPPLVWTCDSAGNLTQGDSFSISAEYKHDRAGPVRHLISVAADQEDKAPADNVADFTTTTEGGDIVASLAILREGQTVPEGATLYVGDPLDVTVAITRGEGPVPRGLETVMSHHAGVSRFTAAPAPTILPTGCSLDAPIATATRHRCEAIVISSQPWTRMEGLYGLELHAAGTAETRFDAPNPGDPTPADNQQVRRFPVHKPDLAAAISSPAQARIGRRTPIELGLSTMNGGKVATAELIVAPGPGSGGFLFQQLPHPCAPIPPQNTSIRCSFTDARNLAWTGTAQVVADPGQAPLVLVATATPDGERDQNPADNRKVLTVPVVGPDFSVTELQELSTGPYAVGDAIEWRFQVGHDELGEEAAAKSIAVQIRPTPAEETPAVRITSVSSDGGVACAEEVNTFSCAGARLTSPFVQTVTVRGQVVAVAPARFAAWVSTTHKDPNPSNDTRWLPIDPGAARLVSIVEAPGDGLIRGRQQPVNLTVRNEGDRRADTLTAQLYLRGVPVRSHAASDGATCEAEPELVSCTWTQVDPLQTRSLTLLAEPAKAGPIETHLTLTSPQAKPKTTVLPGSLRVKGADLAVVATAPARVTADEAFDLNILSIANYGPAAPLAPRLRVTWDPAVLDVGSPLPAGCESPVDGRIQCAVAPADLPPGGILAMTLPLEGEAPGVAQVTTWIEDPGEPDESPGNNTSPVAVEVRGTDLGLSLSVSPGSVAVGGSATATVVVTNDAQSADASSYNLSLIGVDSGIVVGALPAGCVDLGGGARCTGGALAAGASHTWTLPVRGTRVASPGVIAAVLTNASPADGNANNDRREVQLSVGVTDTDGDGVSDAAEDANGGDANGDGVPDRQQPNVTPNSTRQDPLTTETPPGTQQRSAGSEPVPSPPAGNRRAAPLPGQAPAGWHFPVGAVRTEISGFAPGATVPITLHLPPGTPAAAVWAYSGAAWVDLGANVVDGGTAAVSVADGGPADADSAADGKLTLTLGPALRALVVDDPGDAPDLVPGNGSCATSTGACTLRAALMEAEALGAPRAIRFGLGPDFPGDWVWIEHATPLPAVSAPVVIDASELRRDFGDAGVRVVSGVGGWGPFQLDLAGDRSAVIGLHLDSSGPAASQPATGVASNLRFTGDHALALDVETTRGGSGIRGEGAGLLVRGGQLIAGNNLGVFDDGSPRGAVHLLGATDARVERVHFPGAVLPAVAAQDSNGVRVTGSRFALLPTGVRVVDSVGVVVRDNVFGLRPDDSCDRFEFMSADGSLIVGRCGLTVADVVELVGEVEVEVRDNVVARADWLVHARGARGAVDVGGNVLGLTPDGGCLPHPSEGYCRTYADGFLIEDSEGLVLGDPAVPDRFASSKTLAWIRGSSSGNVVRGAVLDTEDGAARFWAKVGFSAGAEWHPAQLETVFDPSTHDNAVEDADLTYVQLQGTDNAARRVRIGFDDQVRQGTRRQGIVLESATRPVVEDSTLWNDWVLIGASTDALVSGNHFNWDAERGALLTTPFAAVRVLPFAEGVRIEDNVIVGSGSPIEPDSGLGGLLIRNNHLGVLPDGTVHPNAAHGIWLRNTSDVRIEDNVFAGHPDAAVLADFTSHTGLVLLGNRVGLMPDGTLLPSGRPEGATTGDDGFRLRLVEGVLGDGTAAGANHVVGRAGKGVILTGLGAYARVPMRHNLLWGNAVDLDLGDDGWSPSADPGDGDDGPNGLQNAPTLTATRSGGRATGTATLRSAPNTAYVLDLYGTTGDWPALERWLGEVALSTDGAGLGAAPFDVALPADVLAIGATATGPGGSSEPGPAACFGACDVGADLVLHAGVSEWTNGPGQPAEAIFQVENAAEVAAEDVVLEIELPDCAATAPDYTELVSCVARTGGLTCAAPALAPGEWAQVLLYLTCPEGGPQPWAAAVTHGARDAHPEDNAASGVIAFHRAALSVALDGAPTSLGLGELAAVEAHVANGAFSGPALDDIALVYTLPPTLAVEDAAGCDVSGATVTCALPPIAAQGDQGVAITVRAVAPGDGLIAASWAGPYANLDGGPDRAERSVTVRPSAADLGLTLTQAAPWRRGEPAALELRVANGGPDPSAPTALVVDGGALMGGDPRCVDFVGWVACPVPGLPAGGAASFAIALDPPQAPAAVSACLPGGDGNLANDCAALTLEAAAVDVGLAWVGPGPVTPEQPVDVPLDLLIVGGPVDVAVRVEASGAVLEALPPGCTGTAGLAVCAIDAASGAVRLPLRAAPLGAGASLTARRLGPLVDDVAANDLAIVALPVDGPGPCGDGAAPIDLGPLSGAAPSDAGAGFTADGQAWVLAEDPEAGAALTWPALDLPPGTTRLLLSIDHAWTGAEALSAALFVDGIPVDLAPSWDLAPLVGHAPAGATSRAVVDAVAARAGLRLAADGSGATWRIEAARLAACVTEAHADLVVALGPGPAAAGVGEVVEIPVAVSGPGPATLTVAAQGVELVGLSGLGACELGCDGACARCEAVSLPAAGAVLALGGEDAVARLTVAALAGVDPTPEDAVATVSFPVGEPPPTLTWAGAPTSLPPGGAGEATLIVADALGRAVVELDLGVAGGSFALGACVEPGRPCAVAPGSHLVALRAGGPGTLRVEAAAAEADGPVAAVEIPIGPVAARAVSIDAPAGPWLAGVPVGFTMDIAATDPGLTLTVRAPAALTTTDPRCAPVDGGLRCAVDGAAAIHATAVPAVGPLALVAAIDGPAADADPEDDVAVHLVEVVADCAAATCDDANPCTEDACDPARGCVSAPLDGTCAAADACDAPGVCMEGACVPLVICDDGDPCTVDACEDGACAHAAADEGSACLDDACTEAGACVEGACAPLFTAACDDGDACTDDACDPEGGCDHEAVITPACCAPAQARVGCAGDASVWLDACGVVSGPLEGCDDGDPCTLDACVEGVGCEHTPSGDPDCACDGVAVGAACVGDGVALVDACGEPVGDVFSCEDGDACTLDYCDPTAAVCARTLDPTCEGAVCEGEWTLTCEGELATWEDPCGEPAGPADRCASEDPCVAWACVEEAGCAAEPACLEQACDARPGTLACEAGDAVARDACGVELGRLECAALGERATCDAESGRCVRPADPSDLPDTWRADGGVDTGDTDTRRGSCGCATGGPGGELVGLLGLALGLGIRRRRARTAAPAHARAASNSCASAADRPKCPPLGGP